MAQKIASLYAEIGADTSGLQRGINETQSGLDRLGQNMTRAGTVMSAAITLPVMAGFTKMIGAASDLSETVSKVGVVFGDSADDVMKFGETSARSLGMSKEAALAAAGTYGNLFTSLGLAQDASAELSMNTVQLAADLASFNNMDPTVVLDKLRAGLTGETEPLKSLGIALSQAKIEAKAMEMGLMDLGGELTSAAKIQATYALIVEGSVNAQGDFARTSDGLANTQRILKAEIGNVAAEMGEHLLPIALELTRGAADLVQKFSDMEPASQKAILGLVGIAGAAGPVLMVMGQLAKAIPAAFAFLASPPGMILAGLGLVALSVYGLSQEFKKNAEAQEDYQAATIDTVTGTHNVEAAVRGARVEWEKYQTLMEMSTPYHEEAARIHEEIAQKALEQAEAVDVAASSVMDYKTAMSDLNYVIDSDLGDTTRDFIQTQGDLETQMEGVRVKIEELKSSGDEWVRDEEGNWRKRSEWVGELETDYGTLKTQYDENAKAHNEATSRIILDLVAQKLALTDLPLPDQMNAIAALGQAWGIYDETAAGAIEETGKAVEILMTEGLGPFLTYMQNIKGALNGIEGVYDVTFNVSVIGDDYSGLPATSSNNVFVPPGTYDAEWASGVDSFVVPSGYPNDSFSAGLTSGEVVSVSKPGETPSGGGDTYNITMSIGGGSDGYEAYQQFRQALDNDLRAKQNAGVRASDY